MKGSEKQGQEKQKIAKIKTFPVPFAIEKNKENIYIPTNTVNQTSQEKLINQAFKFHSEGNIAEASKYYQLFINQGFKDQRVFSNYGIILKNLGKLKEAEISYRRAIELSPDFAEAHSNLGNILKDLGKLQEAEFSYRKAIELNPDFTNTHNNLGLILSELGKLQDAELSFRKAIKIKPVCAEAYSNLGNILKDLGKLKEAELSFHKAIKIKPDYAEGYFNLAHLELLKGNYKSGLKNYEFRFKKKKPTTPHIKTKIKSVTHEQLQKGEKLLVVSEQGLGDTLQYMRYVPYLQSQGFDIDFCAQTQLHSLIKASAISSDPLTTEQASQVSLGQWIPLLSLARYLKVSPDNPIISEPYINSTDNLKKKWKKILSQEKRAVIGINWQGNPTMEKSFYQGRSIPLEIFSILPKHHDITLLSLQKGFGSEQLDCCSFTSQFVKCQPQIDSTWDFLENAAIIENCDLIITCDTSIAHLAGGMGKKVWLLLRDIPYWTWGLEGKKTFWYPSMKLFRQHERHNWHEVMTRVSSALKKEIKSIMTIDAKK